MGGWNGGEVGMEGRVVEGGKEGRNPNTFGFRTGHFCSVVHLFGFRKRPITEHICSDFRRSVDRPH